MIHLFPMCYSKAKTIQQVLDRLEKAPKQVENSPEAWDGLVMEFHTDDDSRPGTLNEYYTLMGIDGATLQMVDGYLTISRQANGSWVEI